MRFLSQIDPDALGALPIPGVFGKGMLNDIWGWTSPAGQEYALVGTTAGLAVVRVTDPENPEFLGSLESQAPGNYTSGTRVLQIDRDATGMVSLRPIAHMDTEPRLPKNILNLNQELRHGTAFLGQWGVFPLFDSGTIIASDRNNGLIVMRLSDQPCQGIRCSQ